MKELEYPFDEEYILKKAKRIKKDLLSEDSNRIKKKVAVLGGSTTHDVIKILDLFLLNYGIEAEFYESEFDMYWQDAMFGNEELNSFSPDIIYIHTSNRNIVEYPNGKNSTDEVAGLLHNEYNHYHVMWDKLFEKFNCPIIQNNFEYPYYRLLGNKDAYDSRGRVHFVNQLNEHFYEYARKNENFYINDINYLASCYGLDKWSDSFYWHMYKYALSMSAIPYLSFNIANIIKALYGKNKKALVLDLDNTLWGGVVGDDGPENLEIGQETSMGQVFLEFQNYIKDQKELGIILNVCSKNEHENAILGLNHPEGTLVPEDFILIKANWDAKSKNIIDIANELNVMPDSLVFVDDNPAEREIVRQQTKGVAVPEMDNPENYIKILDKSGFFEVTNISQDDLNRNEMYKANIQRQKQEECFGEYCDYLKSLEMKALIKEFEPIYMSRISQLTNKSNQFNLTTKRYTQAEIEEVSESENHITLYGKLKDKFGDNGLVSVIIGKINGDIFDIELWIMSCRVLKRDMEFAMMDQLVEKCKAKSIKKIKGYYYPTQKNGMVKNFYETQGFSLIEEDGEGNSIWEFDLEGKYIIKNSVISLEG